MMEIEEFYQLPIKKRIERPISFLLNNGFLNEISSCPVLNRISIDNIEKNKANSRLEVRVTKEKRKGIDTKKEVRQWILASVWYINNPIMIIRNKEYYPGDRLPDHFITDSDNHKRMVWFVHSFLKEMPLKDISNDPGSFNIRNLYGESIIDEPQIIIKQESYNLELAKEAINKKPNILDN